MPDRCDVLVLGESILDIVDDGSTRRSIPGGSAANVALGLARREVDVLFATWIGRDDAGDRIVEHLSGAGVRLAPGSVTASRTSTALARRAPSGDVDYEFDVAWEPRLPPEVDSRVLHVGAIPAFADPGLVDALARRRPHRLVTFDPNVRPALLDDLHRARRHFLVLAGVVDVLKLSDEDAEVLLPSVPLDEVVDRLLQCGVSIVVLTRGAAGLQLATPTDRVEVPGRRVPVVDTIGAGDTVMTSLIVDLVRGSLSAGMRADGLTAAGERAVAAAAITVGRAGADLPWAVELHR